MFYTEWLKKMWNKKTLKSKSAGWSMPTHYVTITRMMYIWFLTGFDFWPVMLLALPFITCQEMILYARHQHETFPRSLLDSQKLQAYWDLNTDLTKFIVLQHHRCITTPPLYILQYQYNTAVYFYAVTFIRR